MQFYMNTDSGESTTIEEIRPEENRAVLLAADFKFIERYNFENFNFNTFEHDIIDMVPGEFEWWYTNTFAPWLAGLDNNYLDIDFVDLDSRFESQAEKRIFMLKIINFVMYLLPYEILKKVFHNLEIYENDDALDFIREENNLILMREAITEELDNNALQVDSFIETLRHFEKIAKKNLVEENIALLDEHIQKQNFFLEIFKRLIQECDMFKLRDLIYVMLENDAKNIL